MIEVRIYKDKTEIGRVRISNMQLHDDGTADYSVELGVERVGAVGIHSRVVSYFPRLKYNVLALLKQALETLEPKELELEREVGPSDLAREVRGIGRAFPR